MNNDKTVRIRNYRRFVEEISAFGNQAIVYRGQTDESWEVTSSAYRRLSRKNTIELDSAMLVKYNEELIRKARRYTQGIQEIPDIRLLAKLQHYGAATSLIDFTKSALVALWFACEDDKKNGKIFCLDMSNPDKFLELASNDEEKNINEILTLEFREENDSHLSPDNIASSQPSNIMSGSGKGKVIAKWEPPITDNRILKQDSFFIFNKMGKLNQLDKTIIIKTIIILKNSKKSIREELKQLANFSEETIFPDFYGFAQNNNPGNPYHPGGDTTYYDLGVKKSALGEHEKAIENYTKAIELDPQNAIAYHNRGNAYFHLGRYEEVIKDYDKAIELNPKFAEVYYNRGNTRFHLGQHEETIRNYDKAIELDPQYAFAYVNRGNAHLTLKHYGKAMQDYDQAIELDPQDAETYNNRGNAHFALEHYDKAIQDYSKAIELDPKLVEAYTNRGNVNRALRVPEEAIKDYDHAIEINPQYAEAYNGRGVARSAFGQHEEAIQDYTEAKKLYERNGDMAKAGKCEQQITRLKKLIADNDDKNH